MAGNDRAVGFYEARGYRRVDEFYKRSRPSASGSPNRYAICWIQEIFDFL